MPIANQAIVAFNRGRISPLALGRIDLKRYAQSAEIQTNFMPRSLGSAMLRPGWAFLDDTANDNQGVNIPFVFSLTDTALVELTNQLMRVRVNEVAITRPSVTTAVTNGNFNTDLSGWTNGDEAGATSQWVAGPYMSLAGNGASRAIESQQVTVSGGNISVLHALRIVVARGNIVLRVGTSLGDDSYVARTTLAPGTHSLAFTPTGNFFIEVTNATVNAALISSINVEAAGVMTLPAPWLTADLHLVRWDQSADVIYVACDGYKQYRIERRGTNSWSIVTHYVDDGPFLLDNVDPSISMTVGALTGDTTLASSNPYFKSAHVGALFRLTSVGQNTSNNLGALNQASDYIKVTGVGYGERVFSINVSGTWSATLTLQRSVGSPGSWEAVPTDQYGNNGIYTTNGAYGFMDGLDNQTIYYRVQVTAYTSGSAVVAMVYAGGGITGICRVTAFTDEQHVNVSILKAMGAASVATTDWSEGAWSGVQGYPTAVALNEGRLWWAGRDKVWASVSDAYQSHDDTVVGDSGPISRSIGSGPVDRINWLIPLLRFAMGGQLQEFFAFSDAIDNPMTPTNFNIKAPSNQGSAAVNAVKHNTEAIFVQNSGTRLYTVRYDNLYQQYANQELTVYCPEIGLPGITRLTIQHQPDTRIWALRSDGTIGVLIYDKIEEVQCWIDVVTDGVVEDVVVMPGTVEDKVYFLVKRVLGSSPVTKRYFERAALESECIGGTINKNADAHVLFSSGSPTTAITGLPYPDGTEVVLWADGKDYSPLQVDANGIPQLSTPTTFTVTSGGFTAPAAVSNAVIGLFYDAFYKGTKLAYGAQLGTALNQMKNITGVGLVLANTHYKGILYGRELTSGQMYDLPGVEDGQPVAADKIWDQYDKEMISLDGSWGTDERLCLYAAAPRPATLIAYMVSMQTNEKG